MAIHSKIFLGKLGRFQISVSATNLAQWRFIRCNIAAAKRSLLCSIFLLIIARCKVQINPILGQTYKYKYSVNGEWKLNDKGKTDGQFNICELSALANPMPVQSLQNSQQTENELTNKNMTSENPMVFRKNVAQNNLKSGLIF